MHVVTSLDYKLILKNVKHVLNLKVNLLSLSKLDKIDYKPQFARRVWKLFKFDLFSKLKLNTI